MSTSGKMDLREATKNISSRNNRVDKQQNPTVQHKELYSISCDRIQEKRI